MSRLVGFGFMLVDAVATVAAVLSSSGAMLMVFVSLIASFILAIMSSSVRSVLWPEYFWGDNDS